MKVVPSKSLGVLRVTERDVKPLETAVSEKETVKSLTMLDIIVLGVLTTSLLGLSHAVQIDVVNLRVKVKD